MNKLDAAAVTVIVGFFIPWSLGLFEVGRRKTEDRSRKTEVGRRESELSGRVELFLLAFEFLIWDLNF